MSQASVLRRARSSPGSVSAASPAVSGGRPAPEKTPSEYDTCIWAHPHLNPDAPRQRHPLHAATPHSRQEGLMSSTGRKDVRPAAPRGRLGVRRAAFRRGRKWGGACDDNSPVRGRTREGAGSPSIATGNHPPTSTGAAGSTREPRRARVRCQVSSSLPGARGPAARRASELRRRGRCGRPEATDRTSCGRHG
jgi:hypothetical protein